MESRSVRKVAGRLLYVSGIFRSIHERYKHIENWYLSKKFSDNIIEIIQEYEEGSF